MADKLYLDDLSVGMTVRTGSLLVTSDDIIAFATLYDPQPFHTDAVAARDSFFGELVASGWHTVALTMRLSVQDGFQLARGIVGAGAEITFPKPVKPGDRISVVIEILEIHRSKSRPDRATVLLKSTTLNQNDDPVQVMTARVLSFARVTPDKA